MGPLSELKSERGVSFRLGGSLPSDGFVEASAKVARSEKQIAHPAKDAGFGMTPCWEKQVSHPAKSAGIRDDTGLECGAGIGDGDGLRMEKV